MIINVDGYKMIFFLENILREYVNKYFNLDNLSNEFKTKVEETAIENGESNIDDFEVLLRYSHLGDLVSLVRSKKFKQVKSNLVDSINISPLIKHRNNIMHSRSITADEMDVISSLCNKIINSLNDDALKNKWNKFISEDINDFIIPSVYIEYPIGKNFDELIGRTEELKSLKEQIRIPMPVSIVGYGGLGKTALVLQLIEDFIFSPDRPFDRIFFMSFKNTVFENGSIRRFEKVISNHKDLINRLAFCMGIPLEKEFEVLEELVWDEVFTKKTLLILDNLETEVVKSNLSEFTDIAQRFISNFNKESRLIITSRYGLGDREAKLPLNQFDVNKTKALIEQYLPEVILSEKKIDNEDWDWIQDYTRGTPGLIIAFCNMLNSTRKRVLDLRVEYNTKYTTESRELHNQLDEFLGFCFENTIESLNEASQIFLSTICYLCSETNLDELNEEFLTYIREELELEGLGNENLRAIILVNIGFLQSIPSSDRYYVNELFISFLDGNFSDNIFNVFKLKNSKWINKVDTLINHINELQFNEEISLGRLLSELYTSKYKSENNKKYLVQAFFCLPTLDNLTIYYKRASEIEVLNNFSLLDKVGQQLLDFREKQKQEQIIKILLTSLLKVNQKIIKKQVTKIKQSDLIRYYEQMELKIPILKRSDVNIDIRKLAIRLLTYLRQYNKAENFLIQDSNLIIEKFNLYLKQLGDLSGTTSEKCKKYIEECEKISQDNPDKIGENLKGQFKIYSSRYYKREAPEKVLKILDNYEQHFISHNLNSYIFYLESLLLRMECLLQTNANIDVIITLNERYKKLLSSPNYSKIFKQKRDNFDQNLKRIDKEIKNYKVLN